MAEKKEEGKKKRQDPTTPHVGYSSMSRWQSRITTLLTENVFPEEKLLRLLARMEDQCVFDAWVAASVGDWKVVVERMAVVDLVEEVRKNGAEILL